MRFVALFLLITLTLVTNNDVNAQYKRVSVTGASGTNQIFDHNVVTLNYVGAWNPILYSWYNCGAGPYHIGYYLGLFQIFSPLEYTFSFASPVSHVYIDATYIQENDEVGFVVNGTAYPISPSNLDPYKSSCNSSLAITQAGNLKGTPGYPPSDIYRETAAKVKLQNAGGINSTTISYLGSLQAWGFSGVIFSFYFGQIDVSNNGPICLGDSLQLWGDTTITEPGTFSWKGPNGYTSQQQNPFIYPITEKDTGIYTLTYVTATDTFTDTTHVTLLPGPLAPVITADSTVCAGTTLHLFVIDAPGTTYTWVGPNGFTATGPSVSIPDVREINAGVYKVTASKYGCHPQSAKEITINQPVINNFTEIACSNVGYNFNGQFLTEPGEYTDTFQSSRGCDSINKLNLIILPGLDVTASFDRRISCIGDTVLLNAEGNAAQYLWFDQENKNIGSGIQFPFVLQYANNSVFLSGVADNNCKDTFRLDITADACCQFFIPNAFTPNGDGNNDVFIPLTNANLSNYKMEIFNRWGQRTFTSYGEMKGWNGYINGKLADGGTYYYYLSADCLEGIDLKKKGEFILIR